MKYIDRMFCIVKQIVSLMLLMCFVETSLFRSTISATSDPAHPDNFTARFPERSGDYPAYIGEFKRFLTSTSQGQQFIREVLKDNINGMPANLLAFKRDSTVDKYRNWYQSKYGVSANAEAALKQSAEELEREREERERIQEEARRKEQQLVLLHKEERERALATHQASLAAILAGGGDKFTDSQVNDLVQAIGAAEEVEVGGMAFDDDTTSVNVDVKVNGQQMFLNVTRLPAQEYNRLKVFLAIFAKMHSAAYNAASGAMSDLVSDILSSAQPLDFHFMQSRQLASVSSRLDTYLQYHRNLDEKFTAWHALPLNNFLKIRFADAHTVDAARQQVASEFGVIKGRIPPEGSDNFPLGSAALKKFLDKIESSILLPTEVEFSETEIEDIFKELGLLLETDEFDGFVINSDYYSVLLEFNNGVNELKAKMLKKDETLFNEPRISQMFQNIDAAIAGSAPMLPSDFQNICESFNEPMNIDVAAKNLEGKVSHLQGITSLTLSSLPYQDAGGATQRIKTGGSEITPVRAVLFLMQKFAQKQFDAVAKRSIVGNIVPALQAVCTVYYGVDWKQIKDALLDSTGFVFNEDNYKKLKQSENVAFMKGYLDHLIANTSVMTIDLDELKSRILGLQTDSNTKMKMDLVLRTCELITENDFKKGKLTRKEVEKIAKNAEYFGNSLVQDAVFRYELQDNILENEADKKKFLDSYLAVNLVAGGVLVPVSDRNSRLNAFFRQSLAAKALGTDFVKLVLSLPLIKEEYVAKYNDFKTAAGDFSVSLGARDSDTRSTVLKRDFFDRHKDLFNKDEQIILNGLLSKLAQLERISKDFLTAGNDAQALVAGNASSAKKASGSFKVASGLSQLEFDSTIGNPNIFLHDVYYGAFYNAIKVLHYIDLSMPSEADFNEMLRAIGTKASTSSEAAAALKALDEIIIVSENLRKQCQAFYQQITKLMQFVEKFNLQKEKYDDPTGTESLDVYANIDGLRVSDPSILASIMEANKEERYYGTPELAALGFTQKIINEYNQLEREGKTAEFIRTAINTRHGLNLPIVYKENSVSSVPKSSVANMFAGAGGGKGVFSLASLRQTKAGSTNDFVYADVNAAAANLVDWFTNEVGRVRGVNAQSTIENKIDLYQQFKDAQREYLMHVDFSKLTKEEDSLHLARQLLTAIDLHLRIAIRAKFTQERDTILATARDPRRAELTRTIGILERTYFDLGKYSISNLIKAYKTPNSLSAHHTVELLKMIKAIHPDLRALIGNAIIRVFDSVAPSASTDVIAPVISVIDQYMAANDLNNIISIKVK